ncbi:GNAT family N-acetyltransferase [Lactobacillus sp. CC-MHH1034]|nr:GNAT family N-acetyltransferase [Agrilactobacillus fermenti]
MGRRSTVTIKANAAITAAQLSRVFENSGIHRPVDDVARIDRMIHNANILYTAWADDELIGVARGFSDQSYCCYLSDLAVIKQYQRQGIGRQLIATIHQDLGPNISLVLLAAPSAMTYYPKLGFQSVPTAFKQQRDY